MGKRALATTATTHWNLERKNGNFTLHWIRSGKPNKSYHLGLISNFPIFSIPSRWNYRSNPPYFFFGSSVILSDMTAPRESEACDIFCHLNFSSWQYNVLERAARPVWSQFKPHGIHGVRKTESDDIRWYQMELGLNWPQPWLFG
jgi:hypothetical protein